MNIEGQITILFSDNGLEIQLRDKNASTMFAQIKLNQEQTCQAMGRLGMTPCDIEVRGLDSIGKKMENKSFEFEIKKIEFKDRKEKTIEICKKVCPDGWFPDLHFNSQDSFFEKDGKSYARTTIRRWV